MSAVVDICRRHNLLLIEDCAQAHFAEWQGTRVGGFGDAATFSFYPGKNLGAYGDAGAILTRDPELARRCRMFANHGALVKHQHDMEGVNSRMDGLQAAILTAKLPHIHDWTARRQSVAALYDAALAGSGVETPQVRFGASHVYHLYVVRTDRRDELKCWLAQRGIETSIHYPRALPFLAAYRHMGAAPQEFPRAHHAQERILSLPMYPELTGGMIGYVAEAIRGFIDSGA
jgi:dTDP-4-amino-4,6-dideoxygalactose transaminase